MLKLIFLCTHNFVFFQTVLTSPNEKKQKRDSCPVDKPSLPDIDTTLQIIEWLLSKRKNISEYPGYPVQCDKESQTCNIDSQSQEVQTIIESSEKSIQTEIFVVFKQQSVQTISNTRDNCSQTVTTPESVINGTLLSKNKVQADDKCCQTDFTIECIGKTNDSPDKVVPPVKQPTPRRSLRTKRGKSDIKTTETGIQESDDIFYEPLKRTHIGINMECQTDMTLDPTIDNSIVSNYFLGRDFKSPTSDLKMDFKEETLSPYEHLMISTPPLSDEIKSSPNCSNLLQIHEGKSDPVFTCSWCDKALYNTRELKEHKRTHLHCPICKKRFRTVKKTQQHINGCKLKLKKSSDCNNLNVQVRLIRIEKDVEIISKFPGVFEENR